MSETGDIRTSYEAIERLPEGMRGEIIGGELYTQPRPAGPHALVVSNLGADLITPFGRGRGGPGGWWIIFEPEVHLQRDTELVVPDLAGWQRKRMPQVPRDQRFDVVPDWVCEVLSPSTAARDRELKMPLYASYGVHHAWLIDPLARVLEAYELRETSWALRARFTDGERVCAPPFEALSLESPWA